MSGDASGAGTGGSATAPVELPDGTVTFVLTDIVGSTELWEQTSGSMRIAMVRHDELVEAIFAEKSGVIVKPHGEGDSHFGVFRRASDAVAAAQMLLNRIEETTWPTPAPIRVRVGIHTGEADLRDGDYYGTAVNLCARIRGLAGPNEVYVSEATGRLVMRLDTPFELNEAGVFRLKGLAVPERVFALQRGPRSSGASTYSPLRDDATAADLSADSGPLEQIDDVLAGGLHHPAGESGVLVKGASELESFATSEAPQMPLPPRLAEHPTTGLIGRHNEVTELSQLYKLVAESASDLRIVFISGEGGIGKSALVGTVATQSYQLGASVLLGRCTEDLGAPYGPFAEALCQYAAQQPKNLAQSPLHTYGADVARFLSPLRRYFDRLPAAQSSDPETDRYLLFSGVVGFLAAISRERPLVLILEDLHWADKPSLQLLRHLVTSADQMRLLVLCTYRDSELPASHPLTDTLATLRREPSVQRLKLGGLGDQEVISYLGASSGGDLEPSVVDLAHAIYRETDGNPFFVGEVVRHLLDVGVLVEEGDGVKSSLTTLGDVSLPDSVREVIGARVARLGPAASRFLSFASIIGREFDVDLLCAVADSSEDEVLDALDQIADSGLVSEVADVPGRFSFSHTLIQHTLYQDMGPTRRARGHRRVGEALESIYGTNGSDHLGELAHHWFKATQPSDIDKAVSYSQRAAEAALLALAPDDAVRLFAQALDLVAHQPSSNALTVLDLKIGLGTAQRQSGLSGFRETLLGAAREAQAVGAKDRLVQAALANNRGFSPLGEVDLDRVAVLRAALAAVGDVQTRDRALLLATLCGELAWGSALQERQELSREARVSASGSGDANCLVQVLNLTLPALFVPDLHDEQLEESKKALSLAMELDDPIQLFWAATFQHTFAVASMEFEVARHCVEVVEDIATRVGQPVMRWHAVSRKAAQALLRGDPITALALAEEAIVIGTESAQPDALIFYGAQTLVAHYQLGRLQDMEELIGQLVADNLGMPVFAAAHALSILESGRPEEAKALLEAAVERGIAQLPDDAVWLTTLLVYADVAVEMKAVEASKYLFNLLSAYGAQLAFQGAAPFDPVTLHLGGLALVMERFDEAEQYLSAADDFAVRGDMRFARTRTQLARSRLWVAKGGSKNTENARELLLDVRTTSANNSYAGIERRAAALLGELEGR